MTCTEVQNKLVAEWGGRTSSFSSTNPRDHCCYHPLTLAGSYYGKLPVCNSTIPLLFCLHFTIYFNENKLLYFAVSIIRKQVFWKSADINITTSWKCNVSSMV